MKENSTNNQPKLGTFTGVFVPNVLTILGVILFMRVGWVVGQAGFLNAILILSIANMVTLLSALSISSIATNARIGGGGAYFMISRSLGLEIGGSIGVPLFFAQAISVAFYSIGFAESLLPFFPNLNVQLVAAIIIFILFLITWKSPSIAFKLQNFIFILLAISLICFFLGSGSDGINHHDENFKPLYSGNINFWNVFAIFFPAVTGIIAGASMSGELKDPSKSIPLGTLSAVILTFCIYAGQMYWLSCHANRTSLLTNPLVMKEISIAPALIYVGLWAATLSSALASLLAAPRTLQALASDKVLPRFLSKTSGSENNPRIGLIFSFVIALTCITLGKLDLIAPIISMFFLATYGMTNGVAFLEGLVANPSYRPSFKSHWIFPLLGMISCIAIMFLLNGWATIAAITLIILFYVYLLQNRYETAWGDMRSGIWFSITRYALLKFAESRKHLRNWRPVIMVLSGNPKTRQSLVQFADWMECKCGFLFLAQIIVGKGNDLIDRAEAAEESINKFITEHKLSATAQVVTTESFYAGVLHLLQIAGIGSIQPNTVLLGWNADIRQRQRYLETINGTLRMKKNLILFIQANAVYMNNLNKTIDVWWRSRKNGILMATLAHLLSINSRWKRHKIRIMMIIEDISAHEKVRKNLEDTLADIRIKAEICILPLKDPINKIIINSSKLSEICFLGINLEADENANEPLKNVEELANSFHGNLLITKTWEDLNNNWQ